MIKEAGAGKIIYNNNLLRFMGVSDDDNYKTVLYLLGAVLVALIMTGSVTLIYNSFSISLSERKKQTGLLASVGATKKQLAGSVFYEAFIITMIGLPLGFLFGIFGIGITLIYIDELFKSVISARDTVVLRLHLSYGAAATACLLSVITVYISVYTSSQVC